MPELEIGFEKIINVWQELEVLASKEQIEIEEERPFRPDWNSMRVLNEQGIFQVLVARVNNRAVGYFSWLLDFDMESRGTLIANQTAWYVEPRHPIVAVKMLDMAIDELKKAGVKFVYFHHGLKGRGALAGRMFEKRGAQLLSYNYIMKLEGR